MPQYQPRDVVLLQFPFTHLKKSKLRPALVLMSDEDNDVVVVRITSKIHHTDFDAKIAKWKEAGLVKPSVVRVHKLGTFEDIVIKKKLGDFDQSDWLKVNRVIERFIKKIKKS